MRMKVAPAFLTAILILATTGTARAHINDASSVEALTCLAELVVRGNITKVEMTKEGPADVTYYTCTAEVSETLAGKSPGKTVTFTVEGRRDGYQPPVAKWMDANSGVIVFLRTDDGQYNTRLKGKLTPLMLALDPTVIDVAAPGKAAIDRTAHYVKTGEAVLSLIRSTAQAWRRSASHIQGSRRPRGSKSMLRTKFTKICGLGAPWDC